MPKDTLTLFLAGEIPLRSFPEVVTAWRELISLLTADVAAASDIKWIIEDLQPGSAKLTVRGLPAPSTDIQSVERVRGAYIEVGRAMERGLVIPYPEQIAQKAHHLQSFINGEVESMLFSTEDEDVLIPSSSSEWTPEAIEVATAGSFGAVEGWVETLGRRRGLHFTLYDSLYDRAVSCYLSAGSEELMRGVWGRYAIVEGWVRREPVSGRPQTVRRVSSVVTLPEREKPGEFRDAQGSITDVDESPETRIRRLRDAW